MVERVIVQNLKAALHHAPQIRVAGQIGANHLSQMVMGLAQVEYLAFVPDEQMPVAGADIETVRFGFKRFPYRVN